MPNDAVVAVVVLVLVWQMAAALMTDRRSRRTEAHAKRAAEAAETGAKVLTAVASDLAEVREHTNGLIAQARLDAGTIGRAEGAEQERTDERAREQARPRPPESS